LSAGGLSEDPHRRTLEVYERRAGEWQARRPPRTQEAQRFGDRLRAQPPPGPVVDLGCGPGWHLPHLPAGAVALVGARAMLDLVPAHSPGAPRVQSDLRALPFARHSLGAVWANKSYVHLRRDQVPLALWDVHRAMAVDAPLYLGVFAGDLEHAQLDDDDFRGRSFSGWPSELLQHVVEGAGFEIERVEVRDEGVDHLGVWARRARTLADTMASGMRLLLVGLNPSLVAADAGVGFHRPGNRAWPALRRAGLATVDRDPIDLLVRHRIGMTDLVKRASPRADELTAAEYAHGVERLDRLCEWLRPGAVCVLGLTGWRAAVDRGATTGVQDRRLGGRPVYLMPNPSGANAHVQVDDLVEHLHAALACADADPAPPD
jgi:TDG/mug DNA glycosylase family protein